MTIGFWTYERETLLRKLLDEKLSAGQIAKALPGATRNMVMSKARRMGIGFGGREALVRHRAAAPASVPPRLIVGGGVFADAPVPLVTPTTAPKPIGPLNTFPATQEACRYIAEDVLSGAWRCCGHPAVGMSSWCVFHLSVCMVPAPKKGRTVEAEAEAVAA